MPRHADELTELQHVLGDRYTLEREVGRGGMATVYLAHDLRHDRPIALKVLHAELGAELGAERFLREIRIAARLQHPMILPLLDSGTTGARLWYSTPFVAGGSLRDRLRREVQLPVPEALRIVRDVASALDYAHTQGIVHRDIKPENVLLSGGQALVADFGIARLFAGDPDAPEGRITETGLALGTPAYMSPEQASGETRLDPWADIYALAVMGYAMLAGEPPYTGPTPQAIIAKRFSNPLPSLALVRPELAPHIEPALSRGMRLVPADRYDTAGGLARALDGSDAVVVPSSATRTRDRRHWRIPGVLGLLLVIVAVAVAVVARRAAPPSTKTAAAGPLMIAVLPFENIGPDSTAYFAAGLSDAISRRLATLPQVGVIDQHSARQAAGSAKSVVQIGHQLGVAYLVRGAIEWGPTLSGASVAQVTTTLISAADGRTVWAAEPVMVSAANVLAVQGDLAVRIATALAPTLQPSQRGRLLKASTSDPEAYALYLRAQDEVRCNCAAGFKLAVNLLTAALKRDTSFALGYAALARVYRNMQQYADVSTRTYLERADSLTEKAMRMDSTVPDLHLLLASGANLRVNFAEAERQLEQAIALNPSSATAYLLLGVVKRHEADNAGAEAALEMAERLDPLSLGVKVNQCNLAYEQRAFEESIRRCRAILAVDPGVLWARRILAFNYLATNRPREALAEIDRAARQAGTRWDLGVQIYAHSRLNEKTIADSLWRRFEAAGPPNGLDEFYAYYAALVGLGRLDDAVDLMLKAEAEHRLSGMAVLDPMMDPLRGKPRFDELVRKVEQRVGAR